MNDEIDPSEHYRSISTGVRLAKDEMLKLATQILLSTDHEMNSLKAGYLDEYSKRLEEWRANCTDQ